MYLFLKVAVKSRKKTPPKKQIATVGLTGDQRNWWSFKFKVYSAVKLETIKLFISVTDICNILTPIHNELYEFMLSNLTLLRKPNGGLISLQFENS